MRHLAIICKAIDNKEIKGLKYSYDSTMHPRFVRDSDGDLCFVNIVFTINGIPAWGATPRLGSIIPDCLLLKWGKDNSIIMVGKNCRVPQRGLNIRLRDAIKTIDKEKAKG